MKKIISLILTFFLAFNISNVVFAVENNEETITLSQFMDAKKEATTMDVAIIKYNAGNIYSVSYALRRLGVEATITADPELLCKADKVIFPGVGEAHTTMEHLKEHNLDTIIKGLKQRGLGICLGMQLMCRHSE